MGANSKIEWTDHTWNPVTGCTKISPACEHCYAERMAKRLSGRCGYPADEPFRVTLHPDKLEEPLHWRKPRMVFVGSMGDLFHDDVPDSFIDQVFAVMALCTQHTFQVLTKRVERMQQYISQDAIRQARRAAVYNEMRKLLPNRDLGILWPLPNVWLGVTAEDQPRADERIPLLLQTPAVVRFLSCEPLLGPVDLSYWLEEPESCCPQCGAEIIRGYQNTCADEKRLLKNCVRCGQEFGAWEGRIDQVIVGGETGPGARPMHPEWVRRLRDQCQDAGVPFFFKQWGEWFPRDQWEDNPELVLPDDDVAYNNSPNTHVFRNGSDWYPVHRVGKKAAGALLDGREWRQMPEHRTGPCPAVRAARAACGHLRLMAEESRIHTPGEGGIECASTTPRYSALSGRCTPQAMP